MTSIKQKIDNINSKSMYNIIILTNSTQQDISGTTIKPVIFDEVLYGDKSYFTINKNIITLSSLIKAVRVSMQPIFNSNECYIYTYINNNIDSTFTNANASNINVFYNVKKNMSIKIEGKASFSDRYLMVGSILQIEYIV